MSGGEVAALVAAGAFAVLVLFACVPVLRLRRTIDAATQAINNLDDRMAPLFGKVNETVDNVNTALGQVHVTLDGVNAELVRVDTIAAHASSVTANVANLTTVVTSAAANPLIKVAAFGYGVRRAANRRRHAEEESQVRAELKERGKAGRRREASSETGTDRR